MMKGGEAYSVHTRHYVAVDCVIFGYEDEELKVLLYPRSFEPSVGRWSLLGGFVEPFETLDEAAHRVLYTTAGLQHIYQEQVHTFSKPNRDPAGRVISVAYYALIRINQQDTHLFKEHGARWWPVSKIPKLIFDHNEMVEASLIALKKKARAEVIGRELLGEMFTLTQLKKLYEAIFQHVLDAGNFRKKILSMGVLVNSGEKDKNDSKKGAYLYQLKPANDDL